MTTHDEACAIGSIPQLLDLYFTVTVIVALAVPSCFLHIFCLLFLFQAPSQTCKLIFRGILIPSVSALH